MVQVLTDFMHYCDYRNIGKAKGDDQYIAFDEQLEQARKDYKTQSQTMNSVLYKKAERIVKEEIQQQLKSGTLTPAPEPDLQLVAATDPKLVNLLKSLAERQAKEADDLQKRQAKEAPSPLRHEQERDQQARRFENERERHIRDHQKSLELAERLRADDKQKALEQGRSLDDGPIKK
jgi:prolyl oligopeptidase PreP (S9A serine peptidase family)